jgi:heme O synthase-like polyprenyltransferase
MMNLAFKVSLFMRDAQKIMPLFFPKVNGYSETMKVTHSSEVFLQTLFFNQVFVHFYSLALTRNKHMHSLSVPFLLMLM